MQERLEVENVAPDVWYIQVRYGFFEVPNLLAALEGAQEKGCLVDLQRVLFFAANDEVTASGSAPKLASWRRIMFSFMYRNSVRAPDRFALPRDRFIEISRQVEL